MAIWFDSKKQRQDMPQAGDPRIAHHNIASPQRNGCHPEAMEMFVVSREFLRKNQAHPGRCRLGCIKKTIRTSRHRNSTTQNSLPPVGRLLNTPGVACNLLLVPFEPPGRFGFRSQVPNERCTTREELSKTDPRPLSQPAERVQNSVRLLSGFCQASTSASVLFA